MPQINKSIESKNVGYYAFTKQLIVRTMCLKPFKTTSKQINKHLHERHDCLCLLLPSGCGNFCPTVTMRIASGTLILPWTGS